MRDLLTENEVISGVENYLKRKGRAAVKRVLVRSDAAKKQHGVDLLIKLENENHNGNLYHIEAKGSKTSEGEVMRSKAETNFRWAISQIILRIKVDPRRYNYIYGIAMPRSDVERCIPLIRDNWALKHLKIRLFGAFINDNGEPDAVEYLPRTIYKR